MKRRTWLLVPAAAFSLWILWATARWFRAGASVARSWEAAIADPMTLLFLTDGMMFGLIAIGMMLWDLRNKGASAVRCAAWAAAVLIVGSPAVLVYLFSRPSSDQVPVDGT